MIVGDQDSHARLSGAVIGVALRIVALLVVAVTMSVPAAPSFAQERGPLVLTGPVDAEAVTRHLDYTTDSNWQLTVGDVIGPDAVPLEPVAGPLPDFGYTTAKIWLRLPLVNETSLSDWRFYVHVAFLQQLAIYSVGADGTVTTLLDLHEDSPFDARPIDYPQVVVPFELAPGEAATLVVAYQSFGASRHTMSVETPDSFAAKAGVAQAKNFAFYGMMLVMVALATIALVTLRQVVFAAYVGYLVSILLYIAHGDGTAFQYLWPDLPQLNSMMASVTGSGMMVFSGLFAILFLKTARYHPIMHRVLIAVIVSVLVVDVVLWIFDPKLLNRLLTYLVLVSVLSYVTAGLVAARTRLREVRFYLLSWSAALIPAALFTARFALGYELSFITTYDTLRLGLVVDALMMGLAIFDSYNQQRQRAAEETLAHAQRNLALSQRLASLEASYQQVTANARKREESVKDTVHDLRQPMHALRLSLRQMLSQGDTAGDSGQVESALAYMERLVAERLAETTAPKAEAVAVEPEAEDEPGLHEVLRGIADMFAGEAAERGLGLKLVLAAPDAKVAAYPLMRVTANLVSNAIKYTREGRVLIGLRRDGVGHRIEVHDTGPGLRGDDFAQALVRNQRLERDLSAADGSGLGLAVASETAAANGWELSSNDRRRTGASIRLALP